MLEELLFFYWTTDDPDKASAHPPRLDPSPMRSKNQLNQLNKRLKKSVANTLYISYILYIFAGNSDRGLHADVIATVSFGMFII